MNVSDLVRSEVIRRFDTEFAETVLQEIAALSTLANDTVLRDRVHVAIVKLTTEAPENLQEIIRIATSDWRDVLVAAGMANEDWREVARRRRLSRISVGTLMNCTHRSSVFVSSLIDPNSAG